MVTFLLPKPNSNVLSGEQKEIIFIKIASIANNNEHLVSVGVRYYGELNQVEFDVSSTAEKSQENRVGRHESRSKRVKQVHINPCNPVVRRISNDDMEVEPPNIPDVDPAN